MLWNIWTAYRSCCEIYEQQDEEKRVNLLYNDEQYISYLFFNVLFCEPGVQQITALVLFDTPENTSSQVTHQRCLHEDNRTM